MRDDVAGPDRSALSEGLGAGAGALCACKYRPAKQCPGEWEPGCDFGTNAEYAMPAPQSVLEVDEALALKMISIRLPVELIEKYKTLAAASGTADWRGVGYQRLMRQALSDFAAKKDTPN
jgi:hypothetical protein